LKLRAKDARGLIRLFREGTDLAGQPDEHARHLVDGLLKIIGAAAGALVLSAEFRPGGSACASRGVALGFDDPDRAPMREAYFSRAGAIDPAIAAHLNTVGRLDEGAAVTRTRRELVSDDDWYRCAGVADLRRRARLDDTIYSTRGTGIVDVAEAFCLVRERGAPPFEEEDRNLVWVLHQELGPVFSGGMGPTLSPRQRQTLRCLLEGASEKEIAARFGLSAHTVHHYVTSLYRHFGVGSRAQLIARIRHLA
jgi:DNA-binding CsgD family transcriptional regulator